MSRRPSVSRMRENRTYGLKGGWGTGPAIGTAPLTTNEQGIRRLENAVCGGTIPRTPPCAFPRVGEQDRVAC